MHMHDLPAQARPREKLLERGPQALSDVELLAILLRTGMAGKNVFALAEELLAAGGVSGLLHASRQQLQAFKGLGPAKQAELLAVAGLARRPTGQLFRGTLTQTSVYPREVVLRALHHQSAAVVLSHNHPSGSVQPSRADEALTQNLKASLALVDVRVLDHIIVGHGQTLSMAEQGLL